MPLSLDGSFPPSPQGDHRGPQRLSMGGLLRKLAELGGPGERRSHTCEGRSRTGSVFDLSLSESDSGSVSFDPLEEPLSAEVAAAIGRSLSASPLARRVVVPDRLLHAIGQELLHLAAREPCGLRGALVDVCVDQQGVGDQIAVDAGLVPTFHITLVLRADTGGGGFFWPKVQKLLGRTSRSPQGHQQHHQHHHRTLRLSPSFRAVKRKLYCSGDLVVDEC